MIRITKHGLLVDRMFLQALLNMVFEDARRPKAVLTLETFGHKRQTRIYSSPC